MFSCGRGMNGFLPLGCRTWKTISHFTGITVLYTMCYSLLTMFLPAMASTFEKRFELTSVEMGVLLSANDVGFAASVVFTSYYGNRSHRPRLLAVTGIVNGLVGVIYALPFVMYGTKYNQDQIQQRINELTTSDSVSYIDSCDRNSTSVYSNGNLSLKDHNFLSSHNRELHYKISFVVITLSGFLTGIMVSPFWSIVPAFVEDSTPRIKTPLYMGILMAARALAPVCGFFFVAWALNQPESMTENNLDRKDSMWIGAWWLGYVIFGLSTILSAIPLAFFPREFKSEKSDTLAVEVSDVMALRAFDAEGERLPEEHQSSDAIKDTIPGVEEGNTTPLRRHVNVKDILCATKRLLSNRVYICLCLSGIVGYCGQIVAVNFGTKFMEVYFNTSASTASLLTGIATAASICFGSLLGGFIASRLTLSTTGALGMLAIISVGTTILNIPLVLFDCPNETLGSSGLPDGLFMNASSNLVCNYGCTCSNDFLPVCGSDTKVYQSACLAGCTAKNSSTKMYEGCTCVGSRDNKTFTEYQTAKPGLCHPICAHVYLYTTINFILGFLIGCSFPIYFLSIVRAADKKSDEGLALGLVNFVFGIQGIAFGPMGGALIDKACQRYATSERGRYCVAYDKPQINLLVNGLSLISRFPSSIFLFAAWCYSIKRNRRALRS